VGILPPEWGVISTQPKKGTCLRELADLPSQSGVLLHSDLCSYARFSRSEQHNWVHNYYYYYYYYYYYIRLTAFFLGQPE